MTKLPGSEKKGATQKSASAAASTRARRASSTTLQAGASAAQEMTRAPFLEPRRAGVEGRDINTAPSQWGRRLARLVGEKFGVQMDENLSKNEGIWRRKDIAIKCAKSPMPPVSVLQDMLERIDFLWAVYVMADGSAQIWAVPAADVAREGYLTHGRAGPRRIEIYLRKIVQIGKPVGALSREEVESCHIP
jgi:hypothetical protein